MREVINDGVLSQKFAYEILGGNVTIWRCFSRTNIVEIPREIEGCPVTKIAPYAFSNHMNKNNLKNKKYTSDEDLPELCGDTIEEIRFPDTVVQVGRYCFYNCDGLKRISFTDSLKDWGSGAFTGCHHIGELEIFIYKDGRSTLKDILAELPELTTVDYYRVKDGEMERAHLIFPEFYEEGIENTPARLINYTVHGSGMRFRNCFQQRVLSFAEYDSKFEYAGFQEKFQVVAALAEGRLRYPMELSEIARRQYEEFIVKHKEEFSSYIIEKKEIEALTWYAGLLTDLDEISKEELTKLLSLMTEQASVMGFYEGLSFLMDYKHRYGTRKQRMAFEL